MSKNGITTPEKSVLIPNFGIAIPKLGVLIPKMGIIISKLGITASEENTVIPANSIKALVKGIVILKKNVEVFLRTTSYE